MTLFYVSPVIIMKISAKKAVQKIGIAKMALVVFSRNQSGNAFWEKQGFSAREDLTYRNLALQEMTRMDT